MKLPGFTADQRYFEMLASLGDRLVTASELLGEAFADPEHVDAIVPRINEVEHEADRLVNDVDERVEGAYVTPMDPEDIHTLAHRLDEVIELVDGTARRVGLFHVAGEVPQHARRLAGVLARSAVQLAGAIRDLRKGKTLSMHLRSVKQLEEEGDALYHDGVAALFAGGRDPLDIIKWKELYDRLEEAVDECEHTAQVVHSIALKHGGFARGG